MGATFGRREVESDADDEIELAPPRRRFRPSPRIGGRLEAADRALIAAAVAGVLALGGIGAHLWLQGLGFGSDSIAARHLFAGLGCKAAGMVDLAPAYRGQPGYYSRLDPDNDGRSCVPEMPAG